MDGIASDEKVYAHGYMLFDPVAGAMKKERMVRSFFSTR
jgi:hypothetical protein